MDELGGNWGQDGCTGRELRPGWMNWEGAEARMDELGGSWGQDGWTGRELRPGWMNWEGAEARMDELGGGGELGPRWMNWEGAEAKMDEPGGGWGQDGWTGRELRPRWMNWEGAEARMDELGENRGQDEWTGRELGPGNCHDLPWSLCNPSPCPSYFAPPTNSFSPLLTTTSRASREMTPLRCARLQEGPRSIFSQPVGIHPRCTHGVITKPYWLS